MHSTEVITLMKATVSDDELANKIEVYTNSATIYANEVDVGAYEFYNAMVAGLRPTKCFEVYSFEYSGESRLKHEGVEYKILRVAGRRGDKVKLFCERA